MWACALGMNDYINNLINSTAIQYENKHHILVLHNVLVCSVLKHNFFVEPLQFIMHSDLYRFTAILKYN